MDNFRVDITSEGKESLKTALGLFRRKVTGYSIGEGSVAPRKRLVLYWGPSEAATPLPVALSLEQAADLAVAWLEAADYGAKPQHEGSNGKGFRLYCEAWGQIDGDSFAFAALEPVWAIYGK